MITLHKEHKCTGVFVYTMSRHFLPSLLCTSANSSFGCCFPLFYMYSAGSFSCFCNVLFSRHVHFLYFLFFVRVSFCFRSVFIFAKVRRTGPQAGAAYVSLTRKTTTTSTQFSRSPLIKNSS